jgi:DNA-binding transcriptional regulator YbjK
MNPSSDSPASARDRILDAALEIVADEGVGRLSNRSLASRAGVSLGTLTYHFESQNDVLREALTRFVDSEAARLETITSASESKEDPEAALTAVQALLSGESGRRLAKLELYLAAARAPELSEAAQRCFDAYDAVVAKGLASIGVDASELYVRSIVALIDGLQLRRLSLGDTDELPVAEAIGLLLRGAAS